MSEMLSKKELEQIAGWYARNARPLDYARWQALFCGGDPARVLAIAAAYQNSDGGIGHAFEPDSWTGASSPIMVGKLYEVLTQLGWQDAGHPVVQGALRFLASGAQRQNGLWMNTIPENDNAPHAPWWSYQPPQKDRPIYNPTAMLCAFILRYGDIQSGLYAEALALVSQIAAKLGAQRLEPHELRCVQHLYLTLKEKGLDTHGMCKPIHAAVYDAIEQDPAKWGSYCMTPVMYITGPDSEFYPANKQSVEAELDYLLKTRLPGGPWPVTWKWNAYPAEYAISCNWWQADFGLQNLLYLRAFRRIEC